MKNLPNPTALHKDIGLQEIRKDKYRFLIDILLSSLCDTEEIENLLKANKSKVMAALEMADGELI